MGDDVLKALIFGADGFEDLELFYPYHRLKEEGADVKIASMEKGKITGKHGYSVNVDVSFDEVDPAAYDILVISGGRGPEKMRLNAKALDITRHFFSEDKPVAAICHGPQVLISAGVIKDRKATSWPGVIDDLKAAGAQVYDRDVVVDGNLVTSRSPGDLYAFGREMVKQLKKNKLKLPEH